MPDTDQYEKKKSRSSPARSTRRNCTRCAGRLRDVGLHAQVFLELIFENQLRRLRIAEALPDAEEQMLSDLLAHAQRRTEAALSGLDLEFVELEGVADRPTGRWRGSRPPAPLRARSTTPADPRRAR